ncbi:hypothetical protein NE237_003908 [Protea cynaroides]|uniref:N-acetyltransferase domain-containing protein n=1 Tax=Protea cynaroides TaxID=273540 RepID=A0A9Q0KID6_9MAGN|nr:hypothetical protein NE237_003908 [Protea cynaroides]
MWNLLVCITEKAMEQTLKEGIVGESGPLKRNLSLKVPKKEQSNEDRPGIFEYNDANYWRVDQEIAVVSVGSLKAGKYTVKFRQRQSEIGMRTVSLGISAFPSPTLRNSSKGNLTKTTSLYFRKLPFPLLPTQSPPPTVPLPRSADDELLSSRSSCLCISSQSGVCRASQAVELFPTICPGVVVREARLEDCWEVAETHCSSFFPYYSFPLDIVLRVDRLVAMLSGFSVPTGCRRTFFVAVIGGSADDNFFCVEEDCKVGGVEGKFSFNKGYVAGILTVDTVADFLPRRGPLRQRRTGIAYISNVAVRGRERRKGIAKKLIAAAEEEARSWGCHAMALHCDVNNPAATHLYKGQGFKCIKV